MSNMEGYLSSILFRADFAGTKTLTRSHRLITAREAGFREDWLQKAIAEDIELVLGPCRAGRLIPEDEEWRFWGSEVCLNEAGGISIDVLALSEFGRIGIVETKLAYNPEARRTVVAQVLEYAIHFPGVDIGKLKAHGQPLTIPPGYDNHPFVEKETIQQRAEEGDYLLIIAGDQFDPRAVKLSNALLGKHLIHGWSLALVEVAVFEHKNDLGKMECLLVPHLGNAIKVEERHVVRVEIKEHRTQVEVVQTGGAVTVSRPRWDEDRFFAEANRASTPLPDFASKLHQLQKTHPGLTFDFGVAKDGSLILKKEGSNILEFYLGYGGSIRFRPRNEAGQDNFANALGDKWGSYYGKELEKRFPRSMKMGYPNANFHTDHAENVLPLLEEVLTGSDSEQAQATSDS